MTATQAIDDYVEYHRIVGDDDGGKLFTPEEYERYKKDVLPMRVKNRVFVSWSNTDGMDCKLIGPETLCFCQHRYKAHKTDFKEIPDKRPIKLPCRSKGCKCITYRYVPINIRCSCKHMVADHSPAGSFQCQKENCKNCAGFKSSYPCACTQKFMDHVMIVETKDERLSRGMPVGQDVGYQAMGGITGFSSLADGYMRCDPSGRGGLSDAELNAPIGRDDHAFIRQFANTQLNETNAAETSGAAQKRPVLISMLNDDKGRTGVQALDLHTSKELSFQSTNETTKDHSVSFWWDNSDVIKVLVSSQKVDHQNHLFRFNLNGKLVNRCPFQHSFQDDRYIFSEDGVISCHESHKCTLYHYYKTGPGGGSCSQNTFRQPYIAKADELNATIIDMQTPGIGCYVYVNPDLRDGALSVLEKCVDGEGITKSEKKENFGDADTSNTFTIYTVGKQAYVVESSTSQQLVRIHRAFEGLHDSKAFDRDDSKVLKVLKAVDRFLVMELPELKNQTATIRDPYDDEWPTMSLTGISNELQPIVVLEMCDNDGDKQGPKVGVIIAGTLSGLMIIVFVAVGARCIWKNRRAKITSSVQSKSKPKLDDPRVVSIARPASINRSITVRSNEPLKASKSQASKAAVSRNVQDKPPLSDGSTIRRGSQMYDLMSKKFGAMARYESKGNRNYF